MELYNIVNVMREDLKPKFRNRKEAVQALAVSPDDVERFEYTANCYVPLKVEARHATTSRYDATVRRGKRQLGPDDAMTYVDATTFARELVRKWLAWKRLES